MTQVYIDTSESLSHYGVKGMRWGHRKDGRPQGYQGDGSGRTRGTASVSKTSGESSSGSGSSSSGSGRSGKKFELSDKQKTALKVGAAVAATALVAYGGYKLNQAAFDYKAGQIMYENLSKGLKANGANMYVQKKDASRQLNKQIKLERRASEIHGQIDKRAERAYDKAMARGNKAAQRQADNQIKSDRIKQAKNASRLSDKDLDQAVERLRKEKQLKELTSEVVTPGRNKAKGMAERVGNKVLPAMATAGITSGLVYTANKATSKTDKNSDEYKKEESERRRKAVQDTANDTRKLVTNKK